VSPEEEGRRRFWLTDMDGVLVHEERAIPGAAELLARWQHDGDPYLVLTNNSMFTPRDLSARLRASGLIVPEERIWTSALATADFLAAQMPGGSAFVIGEAGITTALHDAGYTMTETAPDYVVIGETRNYSFDAITRAIRLIDRGSRFIATNPDPTGPSPHGVLPATGAIAALITRATGKQPYVVGKPNPMMFRSAMNRIHAHSERTTMIGDRMDTDIVAGIEAGLRTVLVLTGISDRVEIERYPFRPDVVLDSVAGLLDGSATGSDLSTGPVISSGETVTHRPRREPRSSSLGTRNFGTAATKNWSGSQEPPDTDGAG
jgi:NagD protein